VKPMIDFLHNAWPFVAMTIGMVLMVRAWSSK